MKHSLPFFCYAIALCACPLFSADAASDSLSGEGFAISDDPGNALDVTLDGRTVARYMYAYDKSSDERLHETYKTYLHVFDADGAAPITKGMGGKYTHHRGIFIGWNKIDFGGEVYDRWHMKGGEMIHQEFLEKSGGPDHAVVTSLTHWNDTDGQPIVREERTMTFRRASAPARLAIDFTAKLEAPNGDLVLGGDPEHAGIQYRPADEVVLDETVFIFPKEEADPKKDLDYPWVGVTYTLNGKRYSVVHMNHPANPKETKYSAYRDYGRFGAFFTKAIESGQTLTVQYRFLIAEGEMLATDLIQKGWDEFAGAESPSDVPKTTVVKAVSKKAKKTPEKK
jgi:hypothetical protein